MTYKVLGFVVGSLIYIAIGYLAVFSFILSVVAGDLGYAYTYLVVSLGISLFVPMVAYYFRNKSPNFMYGLFLASFIGASVFVLVTLFSSGKLMLLR